MDDRKYINDGNAYWWDTSTAIFVKWAVLAAIFIAFVAFFVFASIHAQRRMKKGLPPLPYHRWLTSRHQRSRFEPQMAPPHQAQHGFYQPQGDGYNMHPVPPPAYNPNLAAPPTYQPPTGASKAAPSQQFPDHPQRPGESLPVNAHGQTAGPSYQDPSEPLQAQSTAAATSLR
ncbi:MAG: hypothetical protein M1832_001750 [Thelocarpon impressellum]|nr:MAG: hypothetical protein M1832_001750 [Thelocarpon impressellum]